MIIILFYGDILRRRVLGVEHISNIVYKVWGRGFVYKPVVLICILKLLIDIRNTQVDVEDTIY